MRLLQLFLALGLAMLAQAKMSTEFAEFKTHAVGVFDIKDFLIFNVISTENRDPSTRILNRTISCKFTLMLLKGRTFADPFSVVFADPNGNSTIKCEDGWTKSSTVDNTPFSYIYCGAGPNAS